MKKCISLIVCLCVMSVGYAQLKVNSDGNVKVGFTTSYSEETTLVVTFNSTSDFSTNAAKISVKGVAVNTSGKQYHAGQLVLKVWQDISLRCYLQEWPKWRKILSKSLLL